MSRNRSFGWEFVEGIRYPGAVQGHAAQTRIQHHVHREATRRRPGTLHNHIPDLKQPRESPKAELVRSLYCASGLTKDLNDLALDLLAEIEGGVSG